MTCPSIISVDITCHVLSPDSLIDSTTWVTMWVAWFFCVALSSVLLTSVPLALWQAVTCLTIIVPYQVRTYYLPHLGFRMITLLSVMSLPLRPLQSLCEGFEFSKLLSWLMSQGMM